MLIRTVRMSLRPDAIETFLDLFRNVAPVIRNFPGCRGLELWQDTRHPNTLVTYSIWDSEHSLDRYRRSDFFRETWSSAKHLFSGPAQAMSQRIVDVESIER